MNVVEQTKVTKLSTTIRVAQTIHLDELLFNEVTFDELVPFFIIDEDLLSNQQINILYRDPK